jgi:hypothetical protein
MNARLERRDGVHFPAYFENEIIPPLDLFGCVRKREAEIALPIDAHRVISGGE